MKTKNAIRGLLLASIISVVTFLSCKKSDSEILNSGEVKTTNINNNANRPGTGDTLEYYTKDVHGQHFKMILIWKSNGEVDVIRDSISTGFPSVVEMNFTCFEDGVTTIETDSSIIAIPDSTDIYFHIPFSPLDPITTINGGTHTETYCQNGCSDQTKTCEKNVKTSGDRVTVTCPGTCTLCTIEGRLCSGPPNSFSPIVVKRGSVTIVAEKINVVTK